MLAFRGTCPGGTCPIWNLSGGKLSAWELVHRGTCPGGICPGGTCLLAVSDLDANVWYHDDGDVVGDLADLAKVVDIILREGPPRGLILSTEASLTPPHVFSVEPQCSLDTWRP